MVKRIKCADILESLELSHPGHTAFVTYTDGEASYYLIEENDDDVSKLTKGASHSVEVSESAEETGLYVMKVFFYFNVVKWTGEIVENVSYTDRFFFTSFEKANRFHEMWKKK